uniref:Retrotransposon gag domain-containing protein n=1 Tax=Ananas comosus var. bracteatus TaxID=296719 RepID=A0A6V7Q4W0_ANACO|nr:unnamed protein product [Ananas comosus var. bracteatus]
MSFEPTAMDQILQQLTALNTKLDDIGDRVAILETSQTVVGTATATPDRTALRAHRNGNQPDLPRHNFLLGDDITKKIKIEAPTFDGRFDPKTFTDWLTDMDQFFDWYDMSDDRRVRFTKMKLVGAAKQYWVSVERQLARSRQAPITLWDEMKAKLSEKYLPSTHRQLQIEQMLSLRQGSMSVADYMQKFDEISIRCNVQEEEDMTLARFRRGLREEIQKEITPHRVNTVEDAFQLALEYERYLKLPTKRFGYQAGESSTKKWTDRNQNTAKSTVPFNQPNRDSREKSLVEGTKPDLSRVKCFKF